MKKLAIVLLVSIVILNSCNEGFDWDPNNYSEVTLNASDIAYHFETGLTYNEATIPDDIEENGIINEPWCTELAGLCGNFVVTEKTSFDEFDSIPAGEYINTCEEIPLNKVIVFKLKDNSFALVKIVDNVYAVSDNECEHTIDLQVNYPALVGLEEEVGSTSGSGLISNGNWEFAANTTGIVLNQMSSFKGKYGTSVYIGGSVPSSMYAGHIGELRFEGTSYIKQNSTPGYVSVTGIQCYGTNSIYICTPDGKFAKCNTSGDVWSEPVNIEGINHPNSIWFTTDDIGYISSEDGVYKTSDGGASWSKIYLMEQGQKVMFKSTMFGAVLKETATDEGRVYITTNGLDFKPYAFPMHWYDQPNVNRMYGLYFNDESTGWVCGDFGQIVKTENGGKYWDFNRHGSENDPTLRDIEFTTANEGWVCGDNGTLMHTTDGGESWTAVNLSETDNFIDLEFINPFYGWVATSTKIYYYEDWDNYAENWKNY